MNNVTPAEKNRRFRLAVAAVATAFLLGPLASAQLSTPVDADLFPGRIPANAPEPGAAAKPGNPTAEFPHTLIFQDGKQLRGEITALDKLYVSLRRPGVNGLLRLPRESVRSILLGQDSKPPSIAAESNMLRLVYVPDKSEIALRDIGIDGDKVKIAPESGEPYEARLDAVLTVTLPSHAAPAEPATLIFRDGDELDGAFGGLSAEGRVRWMAGDRSVEVRRKDVAGVSFHPAANQPPPAAPPMTFELRNGDAICGELVSLDGEQAAIRHATIGQVSVKRADLWRVYNNELRQAYEGARQAAKWTAQPKAWIALDGRYLRRPCVDAVGNDYLEAPMKMASGRYIVSFLVDGHGTAPRFGLTIDGGDASKVTVTYDSGGGKLSRSIRGPNFAAELTGSLVIKDHEMGKAAPMQVTAYVDGKAGTAEFHFNGELVGQARPLGIGRVAAIGKSQSIGGIPRFHAASPAVLSDLRIEAWNSKTPAKEERREEPSVWLSNGDFSSNGLGAVRGGQAVIGGGFGEVELPLEKVELAVFGGERRDPHAAVRLRLRDGSVIHAGLLRLEKDVLQVQSETLGDIRVGVADLAELVFDPPPLRDVPPLAASGAQGK